MVERIRDQGFMGRFVIGKNGLIIFSVILLTDPVQAVVNVCYKDMVVGIYNRQQAVVCIIGCSRSLAIGVDPGSEIASSTVAILNKTSS